MIVGFRQDSHTFQNICATKEFVVNCPTADYLDDMMETARFFPEGVNELEHTRFTMIPSLHVKPPTIKECPQIAECVADEIIKLEAYFKRLFNDRMVVKGRPRKDDSAEVYIGDEFLGIVFRDDEDGDLSYNFSMAILDVDLT